MNWQNLGQFKDRNSEVPREIYLVMIIYIGQDIMPLSIVTKFHEDLIKTVSLKVETSGRPATARHECSHNTSCISNEPI